MDELDELPTWAARTHVPGTNLPLEEEPPRPPKRRPVRMLLLALLGVLAVAALAGAGYLIADALDSDGNETASVGEDADPAVGSGRADDSGAAADGTANDDTAADDTAADAASDDGSASDDTAAGSGSDSDTSSDDDAADGGTNASGSPDDAEASGDDVTALRGGEVVDNSDGSIRYSVLEGGQLFLRGRVHSQEFGLAIEEVATAVMGPGNVINEYEVDPTTPDVVDSPIYVEDVVLFEFNSIEVAPPFLPILDLGTALMQQNPSVTITVISRTDSVGSEAVNMEVAQLRGQAVVNYWARQGIDPSRITIVPKGEEEASDDEAEAALDRRAEFVIQNLFG